MKRASVSRRSESSPSSPPIRSRSSERGLSNDDIHQISINNINNDEQQQQQPEDADAETIRRSMSDPFDSQFLDALSSVEDENSHDDFEETLEPQKARPTLPRYPVGSTRDTNCWSESPLSLFHVRGPDYFETHKKVPSSPFLLQACGSDLFLTSTTNTTNNNNTSTTPPSLDPSSLWGGQFTKRPTLGIVFSFPWGFMNMYFEIPPQYVQPTTSVCKSFTPQEQTFYDWYTSDDTDYRNARLKLIAYVANGPWIVRNMVTGRPAIMGKKLPVSYQRCDSGSLLVVLSIAKGSATAKNIVSVCRRYMSALTVDLGWVLQAETQQELPECMLGAIRIHHPDPLKAPRV